MSTGARVKCRQCCRERPVESFVGARGMPVQRCSRCRKIYSNWTTKTPEEKAMTPRTGVPASGRLTARLYRRSGNKKLGGLPASITSRDTCPDHCSLKRIGCYALYGMMAAHWRRVGVQLDTWDDFCADVARLPDGQLWRHNEAGDLPGDNDAIDV